MIGRPGTTLWLLGHELRLTWRARLRRRGAGSNPWVARAFTFGVPVLLTLFVGLPVGRLLAHHHIGPTPVASVMTGLGLLALFTLMLSQTLSAAVDALYERGDLELLFSSPLKPQRVMAVRFLAVATNAFWIFGYFIVGPLLAIAALGHPEWLAGLVVLFGLALGAAGAGLLLAGSLFRVLGPRRTRTVSQVLAAVIGAAFFLIAQARNILGASGSRSAYQQAMELARNPRLLVPGFDWPLRALLGEPLPMLAFIVAGAGLFAVANAWLGPRFAADAAAASGAGRGVVRVRKAVGAFAPGPFSATVRKELRLLGRDPALITQVLMRVLYMLPVGFLLLRNAGQGAAYLLPTGAAVLTLVTGQVAASLAWITVSAEDAPELLASAPAPASLVRRGKLAAAALPVGLLLAPMLTPLIVMAPVAGLAAVAGCAGSVVASCLVNVWWQRPGNRSEFRSRRRSSWFVSLAEMLLGLLIAIATGLFAAGLAWGLVPASLAGLLLLALRRSDDRIAQALAATS